MAEKVIALLKNADNKKTENKGDFFMSKDSWVLSCIRNVAFDGESAGDGQVQQGFWVFSDFEKAKSEMYRLIRLNAMSHNGLFDGNGKITNFSNYLDESKKNKSEDEEFFGYDDSEIEFVEDIEKFLQKWVLNPAQYDETDIPCGDYFDGMIEISGYDDYLCIRGADDGPCNGVNPYIFIDCFSMDNPNRAYHCFFKELFDFVDETEHHSNITLIKCVIDDPIDSDFFGVKILKKLNDTRS